ncbi:MAG TPA: metal-dependent hydrolase [Gemmatimonadaceae bacterium]|jgi:membrane-bound metal-dependent hydrolase YbcI (DUF457 family)
MFIGHFAVGFAGKRAAPKASLQMLFFAALFADILWPILVGAGVEKVRIAPGDTAYTPLEFISYPWSHSLLMLCVWGLVLGLFYRSRTASGRAGLVVGLLVVSHWVLDWITHRADMPLYPGGPKVGLGLWNSVPGTMIVEIGMFLVGAWLYASATRARDKRGKWAFIALVVFLLGFYIADSLAGSPPPSINAIWISALVATAILLLWAAWINQHRQNRDIVENKS